MQTITLQCRKLSSTEKKPKLKRRQQNVWIEKPTQQPENREKKSVQKRKHRSNALKPTNKLQKPQRPGINLTNLTRTTDDIDHRPSIYREYWLLIYSLDVVYPISTILYKSK